MLREHDGIIIDEQDRFKIRRRNKSFLAQIYSYAYNSLKETTDQECLSLVFSGFIQAPPSRDIFTVSGMP